MLLFIIFFLIQIYSFQWCEINEIITCFDDNKIINCKQDIFEQKENILIFQQNIDIQNIQFQCNFTTTLKILINKDKKEGKIYFKNDKIIYGNEIKFSQLKGLDCDNCEGGYDLINGYCNLGFFDYWCTKCENGYYVCGDTCCSCSGEIGRAHV